MNLIGLINYPSPLIDIDVNRPSVNKRPVDFVCLDRWLFFIIIIFNSCTAPSRLIVRSGLDVPTFATRRLHACHHATAPSGGRWNCGREMSGNFD